MYPSTIYSQGNPTENTFIDETGFFLDVIIGYLNDNVTAIETKLGVDGSAITTSIDYLVKNPLSIDPGHKHSSASITLAANQNFVTDAEKIVIGNTSGINTGDEEEATGAELNTGTNQTKYASAKALADSDYAKTSDITVTADSTTTFSNKDLTSDTNTFPIYCQNKAVSIQVYAGDSDITIGDGKVYLSIPLEINGMNLIGVYARVVTAGTTGTTDIQIRNVTDSVDMLSTKLTIDSGETGSDTAATPAVIDTTKDDVATNDLLAIDIDAKSTTSPKGLIVILRFALP